MVLRSFGKLKFAALAAAVALMLMPTGSMSDATDVWLACCASGCANFHGKSTTCIPGSTYYCCCDSTSVSASWGTSPCSQLPANVNKCNSGGATYFADKRQTTCNYVDRGDNICRSQGSIAENGADDGCTAPIFCNGITAGSYIVPSASSDCSTGNAKTGDGCNSNCERIDSDICYTVCGANLECDGVAKDSLYCDENCNPRECSKQSENCDTISCCASYVSGGTCYYSPTCSGWPWKTCNFQTCNRYASCPADCCEGATLKDYPSTCTRPCTASGCGTCSCTPTSRDCSLPNNWDGDGVQCNCNCGGYDVIESVENGNCNDGIDNDCDGFVDNCYTCSLSTASISGNCDDDGCEEGESVSMTGTYTGECLDADFFQIDAISADETCDIQFTGGDMSGISSSNLAIDGGTIFAGWMVPEISEDCYGKTVTASAAALYRGGPPGVGIQISYMGTPSGTITFKSLDLDMSYTLVMKRGWNLVSVPFKTVVAYEGDSCGAGGGKFYWLDENGKWNVKTVGVKSLKGGIGYFFYSTQNCQVTIWGMQTSHASDISLVSSGWAQIGSPKDGLTNMNDISAGASNCKYLWWNPQSNAWEQKVSLEEGKGYRVEC